MKTISKQEADRLIAEKVMGWDVREIQNEIWLYKINDKYEYTSKPFALKPLWQPTTDLNQAFEAVEKWESSEEERYHSITNHTIDLWQYGRRLERIVNITFAYGGIAELALAICTALLRAVGAIDNETEIEV